MKRNMPKSQLIMIMMLFGVLGMNLILTQRLGQIDLAETYDPDSSDEKKEDSDDSIVISIDSDAIQAKEARKNLCAGRWFRSSKEDDYEFESMEKIDGYNRTMIVWKAKDPKNEKVKPYLFTFYEGRNFKKRIGTCIARGVRSSNETVSEWYKSVVQEHILSDDRSVELIEKDKSQRETASKIKECKVAGTLTKYGRVGKKVLKKGGITSQDQLEFHKEILQNIHDGLDEDVKNLNVKVQKKCFVQHLKEVLLTLPQEEMKSFGEDTMEFVSDVAGQDQTFEKEVQNIIKGHSKKYVEKTLRTDIRDEVKEYVDELKTLDQDIAENQHRMTNGNPYEAWMAFSKNYQFMMKRNYLVQKAGRFLDHLPSADEVGWVGSDSELRNLIVKDGSVQTLKNLASRDPWARSGSGSSWFNDDRGRGGYDHGLNDSYYNGYASKGSGVRRPLYGDDQGGGYYDYIHDQDYFDSGYRNGSGPGLSPGLSSGPNSGPRNYVGTGRMARGGVASPGGVVPVGVTSSSRSSMGGSRYSTLGGVTGNLRAYNQHDPYLAGMNSRSLVSPYRGAYYGGKSTLRGGIVSPTPSSGRYDYNLYQNGSGRLGPTTYPSGSRRTGRY